MQALLLPSHPLAGRATHDDIHVSWHRHQAVPALHSNKVAHLLGAGGQVSVFDPALPVDSAGACGSNKQAPMGLRSANPGSRIPNDKAQLQVNRQGLALQLSPTPTAQP